MTTRAISWAALSSKPQAGRESLNDQHRLNHALAQAVEWEIVADITEPRSTPHELQAIVPDLAVPVQPLLLEGSTGEYAMFQDLRTKYDWVLPVHQYATLDDLLKSLEDEVIASAEEKAKELEAG